MSKQPTLRGTGYTLSFALLNVPVKMASLAGYGSVPRGKRVCPCHKEQTEQHTVCATSGERVTPLTGFEYEGKLVTDVERGEHRAKNDGTMKLESTIELHELDPLYFASTSILWPQEGGEAAYDLLAAALRESGKALIGKAAVTTSTRMIAVRWSDATNTLVGHTMQFADTLRWNDVETVREANHTRPEPAEEQVELAGKLLDTLPETDADVLYGVEDDYALRIQAAIEASAKGLPAPEAPVDEELAPTDDIMAALTASLNQAEKPAPKAKAKRRKKEAVR